MCLCTYENCVVGEWNCATGQMGYHVSLSLSLSSLSKISRWGIITVVTHPYSEPLSRPR